jgi:hypothetical protein
MRFPCPPTGLTHVATSLVEWRIDALEGKHHTSGTVPGYANEALRWIICMPKRGFEMRMLVASIVILATWVGPASVSSAPGWAETATLVDDCHVAIKVLKSGHENWPDIELRRGLYCINFLQGILQGAVLGGLKSGRQQICYPKGRDFLSLEAADIFVTWAEQNQDAWYLPSGFNAYEAFQSALPCPKQ